MIPRILNRTLFTGRCLGSRGKKIVSEQNKTNDTDSLETDMENSEQRLKSLLNQSTSFVETKPIHDDDKWSTLPYVEGTLMTQTEHNELDIKRPKIDPEDTSIILFPGQGSQFVGMAKQLEIVPAAKDLFDCASEILK